VAQAAADAVSPGHRLGGLEVRAVFQAIGDARVGRRPHRTGRHCGHSEIGGRRSAEFLSRRNAEWVMKLLGGGRGRFVRCFVRIDPE
jgi:hypothetical protein